MKEGMKGRTIPARRRRRFGKYIKNKKSISNTIKEDDTEVRPNTKKEFPLPERTKIEIGSWNVEEKGTPEEIDKMLTESVKKLLDVVCLQRAKLPAPNTETNNYKWLCEGTVGSAILLKKSSDVTSNSFEKFSDDICRTELAGKANLKINVVSCYIPPETDYKCEGAWTKLKEVIGNISHLSFVLAGDFNAQLGKDEMKSNYSCQRRLYHDLSNENGKKLSGLIQKSHLMLYLSNKKESNQLCTFNDGKLKYQQSYIFVPFSRHTFSSDDNVVLIPKYNHGLLCYRIICRSNAILTFGSEPESSAKKLSLVASWNIQSAIPAKIDSVLNQLGLPIVCIQELFLTSDEDIQTDNYTWFCNKKLWAKNVGILIKKSPDIEVSQFEPLSEYLCVATVMYYGTPLTVISFHLPPVNDSQHELAVNQTKEHISSIPENAVVFLGGDFSSVLKTEEEHPHNSDDFVFKLAKENNLKVVIDGYSKKKNTFFTQITEAGKCRTNYILMSQSAFSSLKTFLNFRWVPFFEYGIFCVTAREKVDIPKKFDFDAIKVLDRPHVEVQMITESGATNKQIVYKYLPKEPEQEDIVGLVSAEDKEKFKSTPPSAEDLSRLLKDFVLIQGVSRRSNLILTPFGILTKSFIDCKMGFIVEVIIEPEKTGRSICRIKWNDILLAEESGESQERHQNLLRKASQSIIAKLSQTCHTVKAKKSFFNKGMKPVMMGDPELNATFKVVDKSSFPTMEDVYKHIDEFISEDNDAELVFGKGFSLNNLFDIAEYAFKKIGMADFRFFKSESDDLNPNSVAIFRKRSPQYLKDLLIKEPKNLRYLLIPPCGLGVDYVSFNHNIIAKISNEENQKWMKYLKNEQNQQTQKKAQKSEQTKGTTSVNKKGPQRNPTSGTSSVNKKGPQQNVRSTTSGGTRNSRGNLRSQQPLRPTNSGRTSTLNGRSRYQEQPQPLLSVRVTPMDRNALYGRDPFSQNLGGRKRDYDMMNSVWDDSYKSDNYFADSRGREKLDFSTPVYKSNFDQNDSYFETSGRERDLGLDRNVSYGSSQFYDSGRRDLGLDRNVSYGSSQFYDSDISNKRRRLDDMSDSREFMIEMPVWRNIRPLLIVWPITVRSQLEERPEEVLSENFNINYKTKKTMSNQSLTAVFVTLTLINGSAMTYCIAKGSNTRNAARVALELLVKHCTVIKPKPTFLCNGLTPNFLRYKIPCQLYPRTYLILDRAKTGSLATRGAVEDLVDRFLDSCEEEMYLDKDSYTLDEKLAVIDNVPKIAPQKLLVRHLGDDPKLVYRYVCVYKIKPKHVLLGEVLKLRDDHPRYTMTINRLPSDMSSFF